MEKFEASLLFLETQIQNIEEFYAYVSPPVNESIEYKQYEF